MSPPTPHLMSLRFHCSEVTPLRWYDTTRKPAELRQRQSQAGHKPAIPCQPAAHPSDGIGHPRLCLPGVSGCPERTAGEVPTKSIVTLPSRADFSMGDTGLSFPSPGSPDATCQQCGGCRRSLAKRREPLARVWIRGAAREQRISSSFHKYPVTALPRWSTCSIRVLYHACDFVASNSVHMVCSAVSTVLLSAFGGFFFFFFFAVSCARK